jgi:hypothetical protein
MRALKLLDNYSTLAYPNTNDAVDGTATVTQTTGVVSGITAHLLVLGDTVTFNTLNQNGATNAIPPAPLVAGTEYWVVPATADTFELALSYADAVAGKFIVPTGATVVTCSYEVNHYPLFNGLPYASLIGSQRNSSLQLVNAPIATHAFASTNASPAVFAGQAAYTYVNGTPCKLGISATPGTNFKKNTVYYMVAVSTNTFQLAATVGGAAINGGAVGAGYVYLLANDKLGAQAYSGEQLDVDFSSGSPFSEGASAVLVSDATFLASNFTAIYIETADAASPDLPGAWTAVATLTSAGALTLLPTWANVALSAYVRARVNVLTGSGAGAAGSIGIVAVASATLLGN